MTTNVHIAFYLTLFAGLSTGIGGALVFLTKRTNRRLLSAVMGFSAGVMIYVSLIELLPSARALLTLELGVSTGEWINIVAFFGGILLILLIDKFVPSFANPHEVYHIEDVKKGPQKKDEANDLYRVGVLTALAIAIHNFPEGVATFTALYKDLSLGIPIALAIALHNIPEGIAVAIPLYYATGDKKKSFIYSLISGLSEFLGAIIGYLLLNFFHRSDLVVGVLLASVAGIMVFISLDELLPTAREYGEHHISIYGLILGMFIMAVGLLF